MNNTLAISDKFEVRIGSLIQIAVPNVFDQYNSEDEIQKFSLSYSELLKNQYKIHDILLIRATNNIRGESIVACLMGTSWLDKLNGFRLHNLNLLWFQEGYAFPINPDVEQSIRKLRFDLHGIEEESPF